MMQRGLTFYALVAAAGASGLRRDADSTRSCCIDLNAALPGKVFLPSDPRYYALNKNRWSETAVLSPGCIVEVERPKDVSVAIQILNADAKDGATDCLFAVKSGGHMASPGANNILGGVSLDLGRLSGGSLVPSQGVVRLGAGGRWQDAYDLFPDIIFPGGVCGETGIGGVVLGAGMSLLLADVGWVANNIHNYEIVTADGRIINANATHHSDLFHALKGGGSNFGIVTQIDLEVRHGGSKIYGGQIISPATSNVTQEVLTNLVAFVSQNNGDTRAGLQVVFLYDSSGAAIVDNLVAHTTESSSTILQPFLNLSPQIHNTVGLKAMKDIASEASALQPRGYRDLTATITFKNDLLALREVHRVTLELYESIKGVPDMDFIFSYVPLPFAVVSQSLLRGGDVLGLDRNPEDRISAFFSPRWLDDRYDKKMNKAARTWVHRVSTVVRDLGSDDEFLYHNFAGGFQDPLNTYGKENLRFMRSVAQRYDPNEFFQNRMPGGFKLGDAEFSSPGFTVQP